MKKITVILAALAAAFAVSCTKETPEAQLPQDQDAPAGMKQVTITASIEGVDTKTSYDAEGKFSWTKGDKISVFASDKKFYEFVANETASTSSFTGYIPEGISLRNDYAFFPADPGHRRDGDNYYYTIPEYKDLSSAFSADIPMGAFMTDGVYEFNHITGAALFTFTNIPEGVETVKVTFTHSVKLSGEWGTYHGTTDKGAKCWTIGAFGANNESEGTFSRKVSVNDNEAKVYLPYPPGSTIWSGLTINVVGYDNSGNELILLKDQKTRQDITLPRAHVVPIAPLALPDYVPAVDWNKVDWAAENSVSPSVEGFTDVKVVADKYYMYARIEAPVTFAWDKLYYYMGRGEGSNALSWAWTTTAALTYNYEGTASLDALTLKYNGVTIDTKVETEGDNAYWYMAFPRNAHDITKDAGEIYFTLMGYVNGGFAGAAPLRWSPAMTVTLP